jgi:hypothetical protein
MQLAGHVLQEKPTRAMENEIALECCNAFELRTW